MLAEAVQRYDDFVWDPAWTPPAFGSTERYYPDQDSDVFGADRQGVRLCDVAEPTSNWLKERGDCDDARDDVNPVAIERCDDIDNNCDHEVDEASRDLTSAFDPACERHSVDEDRDGYGAAAGDALCLCPSFEAKAIDDDGAVIDVDPPQDCTYTDTTGSTPVTAFGHRIAGVCYVKDEGDCDDLHFTVHPDAGETLDGLEGDCDGRLPILELDCDGDGAPAIPHLAWPEMRDDRRAERIVASDVGLASCVGATAPAFTCGDAALTLLCDEGTGLWTVDLADLDAAGLTPEYADDVAWDCDDSCTSRNTAVEEVCDGIDNDCDQWLESAVPGSARFAEDTDGIPDTHASTVGTVAEDESDLDGDGLISCATLDDQATLIAATCTPLEVTVGPAADSDADPVPTAAAGCGCDTTQASPGAALLGLALLRRRRR